MGRKDDKNGDANTMHIGNYNLFEVGAIIDTAEIGNYNVLETTCKIKNYNSVYKKRF